jgi:deoxyribodipyrimidine photolyase-related protein
MKRERHAVWILPDQLTDRHPALAAAEEAVGRERVRVVLIESERWLNRLPYHRKRQVLILSAGRHYAEELRERGYDVAVIRAEHALEGLLDLRKQTGFRKLWTMASSEHAVRRWQQERLSEELGVPVEVQPSTLFLVDQYDPCAGAPRTKRVVMESFYRSMRKHWGLLMEPDLSPTGGQWNYDAANRKPIPRGRTWPRRRGFEPDELTREVMREVDSAGHGVGSVEGFDLAVTRHDAETAFQEFLEERLADFGPYEDAMSAREGLLAHSMLSPYMNLGMLEPLAMARRAEAEYRQGKAPLNSVEGFIRQIVGWREYIYWQYHRQMPELARANGWQASRGMPRMFWDGETDMRCIRHVVGRLLRDGYTHHIERLMIICNFCMIAGVDPAAVADWFLTFYVDSHEWVVLPNVIGMGLNADGGMTATKPYISSAAYIKRMSDFCGGCRYRTDVRAGESACPFNTLYWNFLIEHEERLRANPRLGASVLGLRHLDAEERRVVQKSARAYLERLEIYGEAGA